MCSFELGLLDMACECVVVPIQDAGQSVDGMRMGQIETYLALKGSTEKETGRLMLMVCI